jgi:antirestriction protein ArdC
MNDLSHTKADIYRTITDSIIEAITAGAGTFTMPWHGGGTAITKPENALTHMEYHGVNVLMLWARAWRDHFPTGYWASYRQWQRLGAQVEKGAKATPIVFYKEIETEQDQGEEPSTRLFARSSAVFNAAQVRGWTPPEDHHPKGDAQVAEDVANFIARTRAEIVWGGISAHYHIPTDRIHMPDRDRFRDTKSGPAEHGLHSTILHELVHWVGAKHRLARFEDGLRREDVPFEELIAEIGAAFLCADLGVSVTPRPDHAAYVAHWLAAMEGDAKAIFRAARQASDASKYLHEFVSTDP